MTDQKSKKCVNTTCRKFNTEWTNNCSTFVVMNDCPDFVPEELEPEKLDKCLNLNCIYYDEKRSLIVLMKSICSVVVHFGRNSWGNQ